jgi:hypothetical protein
LTQEPADSNQGVYLPTIKCPNCQLVWLAPGMIMGDAYECKSCEFRFVVEEAVDESLSGEMTQPAIAADPSSR